MGLKKKSKVNAQFNMSSLTDIIFLLLIFFMLTSSIVAPNALNLKLPSSSSSAETPPRTLDMIKVTSSGNYSINGNNTNLNALGKRFKDLRKEYGSKASVRIAPHDNSPTDAVVQVLDLARIHQVVTVLDQTK